VHLLSKACVFTRYIQLTSEAPDNGSSCLRGGTVLRLIFCHVASLGLVSLFLRNLVHVRCVC